MIAFLGTRVSVGLAATMGAIEIAGLLVAIAAGLIGAPDYDPTAIWPMTIVGWNGVLSGAFLASSRSSASRRWPIWPRR